jgi:cation diffusion facilitator CzcD-associated flavoprotein CzcO
MQYDAIVIGAGMSGMYALHKLRQMRMSVRVLDAGADVGGTWYWNRYPGCRFDSETISYCYSFSEEILQEWDWTETFSSQPETLKYLHFVADKLDLRKDIEFNQRVVEATYCEPDNSWTVRTATGQTWNGKYLITALGVLSMPTLPKFPGMETFNGMSFHTADWPKTPMDLTGRRVAVVGTGASGVQVIQEMGKIAGQLTVFQRTAPWCCPLRNEKITPERMREIKANWATIFARCRKTLAGFLHDPDPRKAFDVSAEEREAHFEKLYNEPGFAIWIGNFHDIFTDRRAADAIGEFVANKIRQRVKDPVVAEMLIPKDIPFGTRRVPMETNYFEVYNQPNVKLVDLKATPIERMTPHGLMVDGEELPFDVIVYATGFDAIVGALNRIDITGIDGQKLRDRWSQGPQTYMGLQISGFPNMFTIAGPHSGASFCNMTRCSETTVDYITDILQHMRANGFDRVEAEVAAEDSWTRRVHEKAEPLLLTQVDSWWTAVNSNIDRGRRTLFYVGGQEDYRAYCEDVVANGYKGFAMSKSRDDRGARQRRSNQ